jgi:hypothetical protein
MSTFISIIKLDGGAASYRVVEGSGSGYTAYLVKNTSTTALPSQVTIDRLQTLKPHTDNDPLMDKLITAIKTNAFAGEDLV